MTDRRWNLLCALGLLAITWLAFAPVLHCEFINSDDPEYLTNNPLVSAGVTFKGIAWAFTNTHYMHWFPLTYLSHMVICSLGGLNPWWHHLCNLLLHACNVLLLFGVLKKMTGARWQSVLVAALFAVHPLSVESVAWVSERSSVLSTLFWILTLNAYVDYVRKPSLGRYCGMLVWYALGFLSKPMIVTLPVMLLLLDYWPLDRLQERWKLIREKVPLFVMAFAGGIMTLITQSNIGALGALEDFPVLMRGSSTIWAYGSYASKIFWPMRLAVFYPHPGNSLPLVLLCSEGILLVVVTGILLMLARKYRYLAVGWFWFGITVAPVSGLMQAGYHFMADRYMYVPAIGIFIAVVWGLSDAIGGIRKWRFALFAQIALGVGVFTALIGMTRVQVGYWQNSIVLFGHALDVTKNNWLATYNYGAALLDRDQWEDAVKYFEQAVRWRPQNEWAQFNLGVARYKQNKFKEAAQHFAEVLKIQPSFPNAKASLDLALQQLEKK